MYPVRVDSTTVSKYTIQARLPIRNPDSVRRLVGYDEYTKALGNFDELLDTSTVEELTVYDEIVRDYVEYVVYSNVSRGVERAVTAVSEPPKKPGDSFRQHGLEWVVALARVEVAAMLANFTRVPRPFEAVVPTKFERKPYVELVRDGARTHYWSIKYDPHVARVARTAFDERLLAYLSRVVMARKFIHAAYKFSQPHDSPQQQAVWKQWDAELDEYQDALAAKINWLLSERVTQDNSRRHVVDTWRSDIRNLPGAQEALDTARFRAAQKTAQSRGQGPPPVTGAKR